MAIYGYTKNYKLIKPQYDSDTWHDYEYDNLDTIDAVLSAIYASGNWKGFWATNTAYVVGDVVIDRDTDTMYKVMVDHTTSAGSFAAEQTAHPDYYELWSPNNLAESWATKTDGKVSNEDYSAKAYAISSGLISEGSAKEWATTASGHATAASTSAEQAATSANSSASSASSASTSMTNAATSAELSQSWAVSDTLVNDTDYSAKHYANQANNEATNAAQSATNAANSATVSATSAQAAQDALNDVHGLIATPIGTIFQSFYVDESLDIARKLNGQLISSTKFTGFRSWLNTVQTATPSLFTTETNWQAEKTNSKLGQCGKFVVDDTAGTIRLPCVVNAQGLVDLALIGGIKSESLPNINGSVVSSTATQGILLNNLTGAFFNKTGTTKGTFNAGVSGANFIDTLGFDASLSSSTYQDNAPVQQEAIQYPYYIQVATGVEETLPAIREYQLNTPFFFGQSMYSDIAPDNASWLASNGSYNSRSVYPDYYDWLNSKIGQVITANGGKVVLSTDTITDYDFVVNQNDQTFRLPLLNGEEDLLSDRYDDLTISATPQRFTAPANGIYTVSGAGFGWIDIRNETSAGFGSCSQPRTFDGHGRYTVNAKQGDKITIFCGAIPNSYVCRFIYATGNGTLYYYVGDTVQDASLINAGAVLGQLSNIAAKSGNPTGTIIIWSAPTPPEGYLVCNGAAISRTTYARLFNVIGTKWGAGDGSTTFNVPNLYLLSDIKVKGYTKLGLTTYSAPNVPTSNLGMIYRADEPAGASGPFVMFNQNVQNQGIGLTSDVNSTGLAYEKATFPVTFYIRY